MIKRISWLLLGSLAAFSAFAREEYTRAFDKTVAIPPGRHVFIEKPIALSEAEGLLARDAARC